MTIPLFLVLLPGLAAAARSRALVRGRVAGERALALQGAWEEDGSRAGAKDTPVTRAVNLLKEMQKALTKEMEEDEALHTKMMCWCSENNNQKASSIQEAEARIARLEGTVDALKARRQGLRTDIETLDAEIQSDKSSLRAATSNRNDQKNDFLGTRARLTQAIESLKAAIVVLSKHKTNSPESTVQGGPVFKSEQDSWESFLALSSKQEPAEGQEDTLRQNEPSWSFEDEKVVQTALKTAAAFMQASQRENYAPAYKARSGEVQGMLKQLQEEMEADLKREQDRDRRRAATYADLREAKSSELAAGHQASETKEDSLAVTVNDLAEGREDLTQVQGELAADQKFQLTVERSCNNATINFDKRKKARLEETQAVAEAIAILTEDDARDTLSRTYSLLQESSTQSRQRQQRQEAARVLRQQAKVLKEPRLSILATGVELDAFAKVKQAIDSMVANLKVQQADEVKKKDLCKAELHTNDKTSSSTQDRKSGLEAKMGKLTATIATIQEDIMRAKNSVAQLQLELQRASEDRKVENLQFQKTVADQVTTQSILKKALDRLAAYYNEESFLQVLQDQAQAAPPVQAEYSKRKGAQGVMELLEKLIQDAKGMTSDALASENQAEAAYEQTIEDTNAAVDSQLKEISSKTEAKVGAERDRRQMDSDLSDTVAELTGLEKYASQLHADCDYFTQNFNARQEARSQEMEALQQAKQILNGAAQA